MKKLFLLFLLAVVPSYTYSQNTVKIIPVQRSVISKWGYEDLRGEWIIPPQFSMAYKFNIDGIAEVIVEEKKRNTNTFLNSLVRAYVATPSSHSQQTQRNLIDVNGDVLVKNYNKHSKYRKALKIVTKRKMQGLYDDVYIRLAQIDADILAQQQKEQARQDSILMAERLLKMRADSIATAKRIADSIALEKKRVADSLQLAKEREIIERIASGPKLSLKKVKVTGHGLLLSKDKTWREYTIRMDDFNRILVTYEGDTRVRGELDVLKAIYESDWGLLSDDLFHNVEVVKTTVGISQGARTKKFGVFSFLFTLNLDDLDMVYTDEETLLIVQNSISQIERYVTSFIKHYQEAAYFVEPLLQMHPNDRSSISVGVVEKQGNREAFEIEAAKRMCAKAKRKFAEQRE